MSHVSLSFVIDEIRANLGIEEIPEFINDDIRKVIVNRTLPLFSSYYPLIIPYLLNTDDPGTSVEGFDNRYRIEPPGGLTIRNVGRLAQGEEKFFNGISGMMQGPTSRFTFTQYAWNTMLDQVHADIWSSISLPDRIIFQPPNMIDLITGYNNGFSNRFAGQYALKLECNHHENLTTIKPNLFDRFFLDLAWAQFRIYLYPLRKRFENMQTEFGEIILGMTDELQSGRDDLKELREQMRSDARKQGRRVKVYTA